MESGRVYAQRRRDGKGERSLTHNGMILILVLFIGSLFCTASLAAEIRLPLELSAFTQDAGAEIANAHCLVCHSVEYVSNQPPFPRAFWKSSIQKMQQKYGATVPEDQIESLADYLTRNYGTTTNAPASPVYSPLNPPQTNPPVVMPFSDASQLAAKYGCVTCHSATAKLVGPAFREIAVKYKSDADAATKISQQIHQGGSGKWGSIIMPPFPNITITETKALTEWILRLGP